MTVNVAAEQLRSEAFAGRVAAALARNGLPAGGLVLEVTETARSPATPRPSGRWPTCATSACPRARRLRHRLLVAELPGAPQVDVLKLDREFLAGIDESAAQARLVGAVIQLARTLGVPVIAEGIERPAQLDRLRELGGSLGQGFLLGRPMEFGELEWAAPAALAVTG